MEVNELSIGAIITGKRWKEPIEIKKIFLEERNKCELKKHGKLCK